MEDDLVIGGAPKEKEVQKIRSSGRVKRNTKLSAAMRTVDLETRQAVMKARIDGLEGDNLFGEQKL